MSDAESIGWGVWRGVCGEAYVLRCVCRGVCGEVCVARRMCGEACVMWRQVANRILPQLLLTGHLGMKTPFSRV